jgi:hypothetical protein
VADLAVALDTRWMLGDDSQLYDRTLLMSITAT